MYNPKYTKAFYNAYGEVEWNRLERSAYGRLQSIIHADFIQRGGECVAAKVGM
jgi:GTP1/Obg family GTP-binding protein